MRDPELVGQTGVNSFGNGSDIEGTALVAAVERLRLTNADVHGVQADVSSKVALKDAAEATIARYGKVHILVNNAGVTAAGSIERGPMPRGTGRLK